LRLVNRIMGTRRPSRRRCARSPSIGRRAIAELGAGDGTLLLRHRNELWIGRAAAEAVLVDRHPAVTAETLRVIGRG
jgi:hypothetical protein